MESARSECRQELPENGAREQAGKKLEKVFGVSLE
jgi:hypothetical protein